MDEKWFNTTSKYRKLMAQDLRVPKGLTTWQGDGPAHGLLEGIRQGGVLSKT
jgi:hypothetical protein